MEHNLCPFDLQSLCFVSASKLTNKTYSESQNIFANVTPSTVTASPLIFTGWRLTVHFGNHYGCWGYCIDATSVVTVSNKQCRNLREWRSINGYLQPITDILIAQVAFRWRWYTCFLTWKYYITMKLHCREFKFMDSHGSTFHITTHLYAKIHRARAYCHRDWRRLLQFAFCAHKQQIQ